MNIRPLIPLAIAMFIVVFIFRQCELYIPRAVLDDEWSDVQTDPRRVRDPFNTCSPENYDECSKVAFSHLSRS